MRLIFALSVTYVLCATASALEVIPGSDVIIRSALLAPLDVKVQLPVGFNNTVSVQTSPKPLFPDSPVDQRYMNRYLRWETLTKEGGTNVLHIKSEMGFREPVIELMISEVEPGDTGRHAVVVIAPIFPGDVTPASTSGIPAKEAVTTARVTPLRLAAADESTRTLSNTSTRAAYGVQASHPEALAHGMKASEAKPSDHGMTASEAKPSAHDMTASEAKPSGHGMTASEAKPSGHDMTASEAKPSGHDMTASETKPSRHGMRASETKSKDHGMKASSSKVSAHGMEVSSSKTVKNFAMPASEKAVTN